MGSNKALGMAFEREVIARFKNSGWWVHFLSPDARGAQPFDVIAMKDGVAVVGDCKTSSTRFFSYSRLEWNQIYSFEKWMEHGGTEPQIFIGYKGRIIVVGYKKLKEKEKIDLDKEME